MDHEPARTIGDFLAEHPDAEPRDWDERLATAAKAGDLRLFSPLVEDVRSLAESAPYFIRITEMTEPITCECCGTPVAGVPEALAADGPERRYRRGIWEPWNWRRHTARRCEWRRDWRLS